MRPLSRREAVHAIAFASTGVLLGCRRSGKSSSGSPITLYSSADPAVLDPTVAEFRKKTSRAVDVVPDTEATKTTGLVQRILAERANPHADVWWSSEPLGSVRLFKEGLLEAEAIPASSGKAGAGWAGKVGKPWVSFALRARVCAYHTGRVAAAEAPRTIADLALPKWKGRIGIARPHFGTTGVHLAGLLDLAGEEAFTGWLRGLAANEVRVYSGNMPVVRGLSAGEIHAGLTDTDDAWAGERNLWPTAFIAVANDLGGKAAGPLLIPNTIGRLKRSKPHPDAVALVEHVAGPETERAIAAGESRNIPTHPEVAAEFPQLAIANGWMPDYLKVHDSYDRALALFDQLVKS